MPTSQPEFDEHLHKSCRFTLIKIRFHIWMQLLDETVPELCHIVTLCTAGIALLWIAFPPPPTLSWVAMPLIWGASNLICIVIISIPERRKSEYKKAHWISDTIPRRTQ